LLTWIAVLSDQHRSGTVTASPVFQPKDGCFQGSLLPRLLLISSHFFF